MNNAPKNQQISVIKNGTFPSSDSNLSLSAYLCAESITDQERDRFQSQNFFHQLLQQAHEARLEKLADKNLESITIEKNQKIIARGSEVNPNVEESLQNISIDHQEYQQKLSEEMYGVHFVRLQSCEKDKLIRQFYQLLDQLQLLWDQILSSKPIAAQVAPQQVKSIPINELRSKASIGSSPFSRRMSPPIKLQNTNQDCPEGLLQILQKENASLQMQYENQNMSIKKINSEFTRLMHRFSPNRLSPIMRIDGPKHLKPLRYQRANINNKKTTGFEGDGSNTRLIRVFGKEQISFNTQQSPNSGQNPKNVYSRVREYLKQTRQLVMQIMQSDF